MSHMIGIRREDKNRWERRVPLTPEHVQKLREKHDIETILQPSHIRIFSDQEYLDAGAKIQEDLSQCNVIFAIKEIPVDFFESEKTYVFFSHTIKGQKHNMPMLKKMMDLRCTLIDYEKIIDEQGRRLVFFGRYAGIAGMIDTLWAFGQRLKSRKIDTPFSEIRQTLYYGSLSEIKKQLTIIGRKIETHGLPWPITPLIIGFAGYGNVSKGAQEIIDIFPTKEIRPDEIKSTYEKPSNKKIYKVIFKERDMVKPSKPRNHFDLQDYYHHPEKYVSIMEKHLPYLTILINCIYWDNRYPRFVTKDFVKKYYTNKKTIHLQAIGDISCDINGSIEFTIKATTPDSPVYVYNPLTDTIKDGYNGDGILVMAVDNLPCELPRESSHSFSNALQPFVPALAKTKQPIDFKNYDIPPEIKKAVILYHGELTPQYQYINKYL
ncbi:MAG: hypothetical protein DRN08_00620 [Thermoplasmata archaeon]|nr:MAG: hypothetical protein DRN08_00620 [Thermoplasmata archaeon]